MSPMLRHDSLGAALSMLFIHGGASAINGTDADTRASRTGEVQMFVLGYQHTF